MGALVTLDLPEDSPAHTMPWIVTFGPLEDDSSWEPVVCGPYERAHALSLAETVVADEELMAVVEPINPFASILQIRDEISKAMAAAEEEEDGDVEIDLDEHDHLDEEELDEVAPSEPPTPDEVRAGFARLASRLAASA